MESEVKEGSDQMLVHSRNPNEKIVIRAGADEILVTVVDVRGDKVRLGIDAPEHVSVHRLEVQARIDAQGGAK